MHISPEELDALQECLNIGVGRSAGSLNAMLEQPIRLQIPFIKLGTMEELAKEGPINVETTLSSVQLPFQGPFAGSASLLFPTDSAAALVTALTGEGDDADTLNSLKEATLTEIGNIVLNGVMGSLGNILEKKITYLVPFYDETSWAELLQPKSSESSDMVLWAQTRFTIEEYDISGDIMLILGVPDMGFLLNAVKHLVEAPTPPYATAEHTS